MARYDYAKLHRALTAENKAQQRIKGRVANSFWCVACERAHGRSPVAGTIFRLLGGEPEAVSDPGHHNPPTNLQ